VGILYAYHILPLSKRCVIGTSEKMSPTPITPSVEEYSARFRACVFTHLPLLLLEPVSLCVCGITISLFFIVNLEMSNNQNDRHITRLEAAGNFGKKIPIKYQLLRGEEGPF